MSLDDFFDEDPRKVWKELQEEKRREELERKRNEFEEKCRAKREEVERKRCEREEKLQKKEKRAKGKQNGKRVSQSVPQGIVSIDDILHGQTFYDSSLPVALQQALDYAGSDGIVATMPELIAAKVKADNHHDFWKRWYTVHTEENIGIDKKGRFYGRGKPVLVIVHGGGILSPERIMKAYDEGLVDGSAKYRDEEFDGLLDGRLPNGDSLQLYTFEQIKDGVSTLPHRFGIIIPYSIAQATESGYHKKRAFMENPLVIARAGGLEHLDAYFERAKTKDGGGVRNYHPFNGRDASVSCGRVLFLCNLNLCGMLGSDNLYLDGRLAGVLETQSVSRPENQRFSVAPEARKKKSARKGGSS